MRAFSTLGRFVAVVLVTSVAAFGCGGGEDDEPPQILAHQNPVSFQNFEPASAADAQAAPGQQQFEVILMNSGGGTLNVTGVEVRGDVNCAMDPAPEFNEGLPLALTKTDQAFLRLSYLPGGSRNGEEAGSIKDQVSVAITSNSATYPVFEISVCGCIVAAGVEVSPESPGPLCECNLLEVPQGNCGG